jgi:hypothetical protein
MERVQVEVFHRLRPGRGYYVPVDPSTGIDDGKHDPGGLHVVEVGTGDLMARYNGYIGSYGLGVLAAGLARQYGDAGVDPEVTGGWGEGVLRGLSDSHYGNVCHEQKALTPGAWRTDLGFKTTWESRSGMIAAIQSWLAAWRVGIKYGNCPSRPVLQCLLDTILDDAGKAVAAPGFNDEDLILRGQGLRKCVTGTGRAVPDMIRGTLSSDQKLARLIQGLDREDDDWDASGPLLEGRPRPLL